MKLFLARELVDGTARRGFTAKQRRQVYEANDGLCAGCDEPLADKWHVDHIIPIALNGAHDPSNWQGMCESCHNLKSKLDVARIAKAKRMRAKHIDEPQPPKRPIPARKNPWPKGRKLQWRKA